MQGAIEKSGSASPGAMLHLQQMAGNRAVQHLIAQRKVQAKLTVGPAHDKYEDEADRTAAMVMRMPLPDTSGGPPKHKDDEIYTGLMPVTHLIRTRRSCGEDGFEADISLERRLAANGGSGNPLPDGARMFMESRFGADFGGVRIHTGSESNYLNRSMQAQAFTHGSDIYFDDGQYNPASNSGQHLLAHELTHVVQQCGTQVARRVQRKLAFFSTGTTNLTPQALQDMGLTQEQFQALPGDRQTAIKTAYENDQGTDEEARKAARAIVDGLRGRTGVITNNAQGQIKAISLEGTGKTAAKFLAMFGWNQRRFMKSNNSKVKEIQVMTGLTAEEYGALEEADRSTLDTLLAGSFGEFMARKKATDWRTGKYKFTFDETNDPLLRSIGLTPQQFAKLSGGEKNQIKTAYETAFTGKALAAAKAEELKNAKTTTLVQKPEADDELFAVNFRTTDMTEAHFHKLKLARRLSFLTKHGLLLDPRDVGGMGLTMEQFLGLEDADHEELMTLYQKPITGPEEARTRAQALLVDLRYKLVFDKASPIVQGHLNLTEEEYDFLESGQRDLIKRLYEEPIVGKGKAAAKVKKIKAKQTTTILQKPDSEDEFFLVKFGKTNLTEDAFLHLKKARQLAFLQKYGTTVNRADVADMRLTMEQFMALAEQDRTQLLSLFKQPIVGPSKARNKANDFKADPKYKLAFDINQLQVQADIGLSPEQYNVLTNKAAIKNAYEEPIVGRINARKLADQAKKETTYTLVESKPDERVGVRFGMTDMTPEQYNLLKPSEKLAFLQQEALHVFPGTDVFAPTGLGISQVQFNALDPGDKATLATLYKTPVTGREDAKAKVAEFIAPNGKYDRKWGTPTLVDSLKHVGLSAQQADWVDRGPQPAKDTFNALKGEYEAEKITGPKKAQKMIADAVNALKPLGLETDVRLEAITGLNRNKYNFLDPADRNELDSRYEVPLAGAILAKDYVDNTLLPMVKYAPVVPAFDPTAGALMLQLGFTKPRRKKGQPPPTGAPDVLALQHFNSLPEHAKNRIGALYDEPFGGPQRAKDAAHSFRIGSLVRPSKMQSRLEALGGNEILGIFSTSTSFIGDALGTTSSVLQEVDKPGDPALQESYTGSNRSNDTAISSGVVGVISGGVQTVSSGLELTGKSVHLHHGRQLIKHGSEAGKLLGKRMRRQGGWGVAEKSMGVLSGLGGLVGGGLGIGGGVMGKSGNVDATETIGTGSNAINVIGGGLTALQESIGLTSGSVSMHSARRRKAAATRYMNHGNADLADVAKFVNANMNIAGKSFGLLKNVTGILSGASKIVSAAGGITNSFLLSVIAGGISSALGLASFGLSVFQARRNAKKMDAIKQRLPSVTGSTTPPDTVIGDKIKKFTALVTDPGKGAQNDARNFLEEVFGIQLTVQQAVDMAKNDPPAWKQLLMGKMQKYE